MILDKPFVRASLLAAAITALIAGTLSLSHHERSGAVNINSSVGLGSSASLFSPDENLEDEDVKIIASAQNTIDVAMYSFTDPKIEEALADAARRGVKIRIYRDGLQFADEEARSIRRGEQSAINRLRLLSGVEIKIKSHSLSMHLKTYCVDERLLRTGSANWSLQGETEQDNDIYLVRDRETIKKFGKEFTELWNRPDNSLP
jgi:phosphatidylserine/phosphatidylglycerophosphate/cardiolipin synthase-like enzyme